MENNNQSKDFILISNALPVAFKLIKTASSKLFNRNLDKNWAKADTCSNIKVIQEKCQKEMQKALHNLSNETLIGIESYLDYLEKETNVKVLANSKRGLIRNAEITMHILVSKFIYASARQRVNGVLQRYQFECHELLHKIIDYLVIKDTVENGSGREAYDNTMHKLLTTKPNSFFERGFLGDFFITDQASSHEDPECNQTLCMKDYLSTWTVSTCDKNKDIDVSNRELYQIAGKYSDPSLLSNVTVS